MGEVAMNVWMYGWAASRTPSTTASISGRLARARPAMAASRTSRAMLCTPSRSPLLLIGKPASITSMRIAASIRATSSFSPVFMVNPGDCSPSLSVVSKIRIISPIPAASVRSPLGLGFGLLHRRSATGGFALEPGHHRAQLAPDLLDRVLGLLPVAGVEDRAARLVIQDPLLGEGSALNLAQNAPHLGAGLRGDDPRPAREVAELRGVADRVAHHVQPALVDQVHDQLHLMEALEVGDLGSVSGLHKRFVSSLDQL